uniref:Uncharacterized protein n=1 Tax=Leptobrachium leishanense TaxID=445787 RepID=A0A8C5WCG9_9ANUR
MSRMRLCVVALDSPTLLNGLFLTILSRLRSPCCLCTSFFHTFPFHITFCWNIQLLFNDLLRLSLLMEASMMVYTRNGRCYTFNSAKDEQEPLHTLKGGTGNGLELMLDIQQDEYFPVFGETEETSLEAGVKVQIHSQDEPPFIDQLGFGVAPGFQTFVSCQKQELRYLPPPWGDCKSTSMDSTYFTKYSITACRIDCETRLVIDNCGCRMVHMPGDAPVCSPDEYSECDNPLCECGTPCSTVRFGKELSMVRIPSKASADYLAKMYNKSTDYIAENMLVLDIFFEELNYEVIEQKPAYEVAGLLGDIGGQMGLFIGASILTILEIFDYLINVLGYLSSLHGR